jgi:hypothetical protein
MPNISNGVGAVHELKVTYTHTKSIIGYIKRSDFSWALYSQRYSKALSIEWALIFMANFLNT